jgi:hypothetical protein
MMRLKLRQTKTHDLLWFDNSAYVHPYSDLLLMVLLFYKIVFLGIVFPKVFGIPRVWQSSSICIF